MKTIAKRRTTYSPNEICQWFGIPRTTLFRWEEQKLIPAADRNLKGERVFKQSHLKKIADMVAERIREQTKLRRGRATTIALLHTLSEQLHVAKFFSAVESEKELELEWLKNAVKVNNLQTSSINALFEEARQRPVGDNIRTGILELILENERMAVTARGH